MMAAAVAVTAMKLLVNLAVLVSSLTHSTADVDTGDDSSEDIGGNIEDSKHCND